MTARRNFIVLVAGALLLGIAAALPWARYGPQGFESANLFEFHDGLANGAYIVAGLFVGMVYRARSVAWRWAAKWLAVVVFSGMVAVAAVDIARSDSLVHSTGWTIPNDDSVGIGPFVLILAALLLGAAVLTRVRGTD